MTLEQIEQIYEWDLPELWAYVLAQEDDLTPEEKQTLSLVKNGYSLKMHINYLIGNHYTEYPEAEQAIIKDMKINITMLWDEIEERKKQLRKLILQLNEEQEVYEPR